MNKPIFIGSIFSAFVLGAAGMWAWQEYQQPGMQSMQDVQVVAPIPTPALGGPQLVQPMADPFRQMEEMRRRMEAFFAQEDFFNPGVVPGSFGSWIDTDQGSLGTKLQASEDDDSVSYKLKIGDQNVSNLDVTVENGYVSINAQLNKRSNNAIAQSSISESFPVPAGVDPDSAKIDRDDDTIVIRFDKLS